MRIACKLPQIADYTIVCNKACCTSMFTSLLRVGKISLALGAS
jgi:hypothetical protein